MRYLQVQKSLSGFELIQTQIELIDENYQQHEQESFENLYFELMDRAQKFIDKYEPKLEIKGVQEVKPTCVPTKIHQINLPGFTGKYDEWPSFLDSFKLVIDKNDLFTDVKKIPLFKVCITR